MKRHEDSAVEAVEKLRDSAEAWRYVAGGSLFMGGLNTLTATGVVKIANNAIVSAPEAYGSVAAFCGGFALFAALKSMSTDGRANTQELVEASVIVQAPEQAPSME